MMNRNKNRDQNRNNNKMELEMNKIIMNNRMNQFNLMQ